MKQCASIPNPSVIAVCSTRARAVRTNSVFANPGARFAVQNVRRYRYRPRYEKPANLRGRRSDMRRSKQQPGPPTLELERAVLPQRRGPLRSAIVEGTAYLT